MIPATVTLRDANGCEIGKTLDSLVAGIAIPAPTPKPFQGTLLIQIGNPRPVPAGFQVTGTELKAIPDPTSAYFASAQGQANMEAFARREGLPDRCRLAFNNLEGGGTYDPQTGRITAWLALRMSITPTNACPPWTPVREELTGMIDSTGKGRGTATGADSPVEWTSTPQ